MTFRSSPSFNGVGFRCYAVCVEPGPVTYTELALPSIPYTSLGHCVCGRRNRPKKFARHEKFPWVAKLVRKNDQELFCSASLISNKYLISAAHCFSTSLGTQIPGNIQVILNELPADSRLKTAPPAFKRNVVQITRYLNLGSAFETDADIALIKLEKAIELDNESIVPVCLPKGENRSLHFQGTKALLSQWVWDSEWKAHQLMNVRSTVVNNDVCSSVYKNNIQFTTKTSSKGLMCAKPNIPGFCHTISGGALMSMDDSGRYSKYTQIGVGTWGNDCQMGRDLPLIYTRVTETINWILLNTQDSSYCLP
ncbi:unnamed protein product [Allacma fusca]|uniref:Peptidase S1 domain-containing protein n=1 Tax=Allacma fusca TaxID=39272 RepID=A0A8J2J850_9HEXA|nr:unnamed protein product [Allacma fusca]